MTDRKLNDSERDLLLHIDRWASSGYPVEKLGRKWWWKYRELQAGTLYPTKKAAVASFEAYLAVLREAQKVETLARRDADVEQRKRDRALLDA